MRLQRVIGFAFWLAFATVLGRISGLVREFVVIDQVGLSAYSDLVVAWISIPDLLIAVLLGGGTISYIQAKLSVPGTETATFNSFIKLLAIVYLFVILAITLGGDVIANLC